MTTEQFRSSGGRELQREAWRKYALCAEGRCACAIVVFMSAISIFLIIHMILLAWLYFVPLKGRREMAKKDLEYRRSIRSEKKNMKYSPILI